MQTRRIELQRFPRLFSPLDFSLRLFGTTLGSVFVFTCSSGFSVRVACEQCDALTSDFPQYFTPTASLPRSSHSSLCVLPSSPPNRLISPSASLISQRANRTMKHFQGSNEAQFISLIRRQLPSRSPTRVKAPSRETAPKMAKISWTRRCAAEEPGVCVAEIRRRSCRKNPPTSFGSIYTAAVT